MNAKETGRLRVVAGLLAAVVAGVHVLHPSQGGVALVVYAQVGYLGDPRPLLFTLAGFALVFGVVAGRVGVDRRPLYLGGAAVTLSPLAGVALWYTVLEHGCSGRTRRPTATPTGARCSWPRTTSAGTRCCSRRNSPNSDCSRRSRSSTGSTADAAATGI